jgi:formyl transferase domain protein
LGIKKDFILKENIIILSGNGSAAIAANNIYMQRLSEKYNVLILEEHSTLLKILIFLKKMLFRKGVLHTLDFLLLRIFKKMFVCEKKIKKNYMPHIITKDINSSCIRKILKEYNYKFVISNACSIINSETICTSKRKIINLHNGINPRYRGIGNFWAIYENDFDLIGVTIHYVDSGIDTGKIISTIKNCEDIFSDGFFNIDINAFEIGAKYIVDFILFNNEDSKYNLNLDSRYYTYPGLTHYLKAYRNFCARQVMIGDYENKWKKSFNKKAYSKTETNLEKMHWKNSKTVAWHDTAILNIINKSQHLKILDIGCGDARYYKLISNPSFYIGVDYSFETIKLSKDTTYTKNIEYPFPIILEKIIENKFITKNNIILLESAANKIPVLNDSFNMVLMIGLLQHVQNITEVLSEASRCLESGGKIIINTLRSFSNLELFIILLLFGWNKKVRNIVFALYFKQYGSIINGELLAKRYSLKEVNESLGKNKIHINKKMFNGVFGTRFLAREMIIEAEKNG